MRHERSAGFVLFRRPAGREPLFLLLDYGRHWDFPKGHVEPGEDDLTAARRELEEETGITQITQLAGFAREIDYIFRARGRAVGKTVIYFLAETPVSHVTLSDEHCGFAWLPGPDAMARLTFATCRDVLQHARERLASDKPRPQRDLRNGGD